MFYELASGVGLPFASRVGPLPAAAFFGAGTAVAFREAGRQPHSRDPLFAVLNGVLLSAVISHFSTWPTTKVAGLPWLTECEGLTGRLMPPYNFILYVSGVAAFGGLLENRRGGLRGAFVLALMVPWLMDEQRREYLRLLTQARNRPAWWNRRLQQRPGRRRLGG
ncbi:hypothetical protein [Arthrobacter sp. ISL-28]|uniref:hypothetical protein n=1 Tax=Arthrobacter sp. ISL-28 TaxID=2819108 RepID=UPI001BEB699A|nr:hypothetical protein [Arthrobacter sp. ISL-28]MBT2523768.1 hypothetical protein [Arthrobacter sp. ISL-28]